MIDLDEFHTLISGYGQTKLCELLEVNPKTVKRWLDGSVKVPMAVRLLMRFINWGDLSAIGGKEWEGFTINMRDHRLTVPLFRGDFNPREISAMFFTVRDAWQDKRDLAKTLDELATLKTELAAKNDAITFYRDQLKQAGREYITNLGMP